MDGTGFECKYDLQENYLVFDANGQFFGIPHSRVISIDVERYLAGEGHKAAIMEH